MYDEIIAKTKQETDKKCPACGGTMDFDPKTGNLACPYCGYIQEIPVDDTADTIVEEKDFLSEQKKENCDWGAEKKTVVCKSCAAVSVYDALQISDVCPYCGSNQVTEEKGADSLAPDGVCPFAITDKEAGSNFHNWLKKKLFCPKAAKQSAKPDSFKGVYLPYWTFDTATAVLYSAQYGKDRIERDSKGNTKTVTDWFSTSGTYSRDFDDYPIPGTERYDKRSLRMIQPFDTQNSKLYKPEYVAGFISERYSVGLDNAWEIAKKDMFDILHNEITADIRARYAANHVRNLTMSVKHSGIKYKYLLLPIWLSSFKYKQKIYQFMVNGQTGKVGGHAPVSPIRVAIALIIAAAIIYAVLKMSGTI
jgi:predicted RNA-binding Zn-ribbon protein involved in translation (DUF1610 family)